MIVLCAGLAAAPAQAAERHPSASSWLDGLARAARVWVAELSGFVPHGLTAARGASDATTPLQPPDTATLKDHVDNPGQTAMK